MPRGQWEALCHLSHDHGAEQAFSLCVASVHCSDDGNLVR